MALPLWDPLRDIVRASGKEIGSRAAIAIATVILAGVAAGFLVSAGFVALADAVGFPVAALVFAGVFAFLALAVHLFGRVLSARHARQIARASDRAAADIVLATTLARSARPILPLAAFLAAFVLARRP